MARPIGRPIGVTRIKLFQVRMPSDLWDQLVAEAEAKATQGTPVTMNQQIIALLRKGLLMT